MFSDVKQGSAERGGNRYNPSPMLCPHHLGQLSDDGVERPERASTVPGAVGQGKTLVAIVPRFPGLLDVQPPPSGYPKGCVA